MCLLLSLKLQELKRINFLFLQELHWDLLLRELRRKTEVPPAIPWFYIFLSRVSQNHCQKTKCDEKYRSTSCLTRYSRSGNWALVSCFPNTFRYNSCLPPEANSFQYNDSLQYLSPHQTHN